MKPALVTSLALVFLTACNTPKRAELPFARSETGVVVFTYKDKMDPAPMQFCLKGEYGIVLRHYKVASTRAPITYELYSTKGGKVVATKDEAEFKKALAALPKPIKVDFYDTCTVSLSSENEKSILGYCDSLGIAGAYYVMCTDFGFIGKARSWKWK